MDVHRMWLARLAVHGLWRTLLGIHKRWMTRLAAHMPLPHPPPGPIHPPPLPIGPGINRKHSK